MFDDQLAPPPPPRFERDDDDDDDDDDDGNDNGDADDDDRWREAHQRELEARLLEQQRELERLRRRVESDDRARARRAAQIGSDLGADPARVFLGNAVSSPRGVEPTRRLDEVIEVDDDDATESEGASSLLSFSSVRRVQPRKLSGVTRQLMEHFDRSASPFTRAAYTALQRKHEAFVYEGLPSRTAQAEGKMSGIKQQSEGMLRSLEFWSMAAQHEMLNIADELERGDDDDEEVDVKRLGRAFTRLARVQHTLTAGLRDARIVNALAGDKAVPQRYIDEKLVAIGAKTERRVLVDQLEKDRIKRLREEDTKEQMQIQLLEAAIQRANGDQGKSQRRRRFVRNGGGNNGGNQNNASNSGARSSNNRNNNNNGRNNNTSSSNNNNDNSSSSYNNNNRGRSTSRGSGNRSRGNSTARRNNGKSA